jgi:Phosphoglycerol transferase and related proteins, alkaline phosphatase superfamily
MGTRKEGRSVRWVSITRWTLFSAALVLIALAGWIRYRFGEITFDQTLLNLRGESAGSSSLATEAALVCVAAPLATMASLAALLGWRRRSRDTSGRRRVRRHPVLPGAVSLGVALVVLFTVTGVPQYAAALLGDATFSSYYVIPQAERSVAKPRNLVTIYLESGENTYADAGLFGKNLLTDLDQATSGWSRYDGLQQFPGGGWTMAGLIGTECGIPVKSELLTPEVNHNVFGEEVEHYLPGARCLGDVLHDSGYTSVFVGGANTKFAGKGTFLHDHGYDFVYGLEDWEAAGESRDNISTWGLSDHQLAGHAIEQLRALKEAGRPFNLTMLTLDTHEPGGLYPTCTTDDDVAMATAIQCSMRAVGQVISYLRNNDFLDDTVVVVMGDHLKATAEGGFFKAELDAQLDRTIILRVWSPDGPVGFNRAQADQLSLLPTTLDLLGLGAPDGKAGLGVSLLGEPNLDGTMLALSANDYAGLLGSPSKELYRTFWKK